jgi:hypothetical protein
MTLEPFYIQHVEGFFFAFLIYLRIAWTIPTLIDSNSATRESDAGNYKIELMDYAPFFIRQTSLTVIVSRHTTYNNLTVFHQLNA